MIVRPNMHWFRILLVWRGSVVRSILPQVLLTTGFAVVVLLTHGTLLHYQITLTSEPFTLLGVALSIFLAFRNNVSYDRFWEGRKLWGSLLNHGRNLTRQVLSHYDGPRQEAEALVMMYVAAVHALRHQLRGTSADEEIRPLLSPEAFARVQPAVYKPAVILLIMGEWLRNARRQGQISDILVQSLDDNLIKTAEVVGGCERIAGTPIPFSYSVLLHRTVYTFCFLLPFGLMHQIGLLMPVVVALVSYTFFALGAISEELEEPFGIMPNDLALGAIDNAIESSLREMLGQQPLPAPQLMEGYLLL